MNICLILNNRKISKCSIHSSYLMMMSSVSPNSLLTASDDVVNKLNTDDDEADDEHDDVDDETGHGEVDEDHFIVFSDDHDHLLSQRPQDDCHG